MKLLEIVRRITVSFNSVITSRKSCIIIVHVSKHGDKLNENIRQY